MTMLNLPWKSAPGPHSAPRRSTTRDEALSPPAPRDDDDDAEIIAASFENPEIFATIYDRHARTVHRYLSRRIGPDDADDLLAEVFLRAFQHRERFTAPGTARPWLYGIATNLMRDRHRSEIRWFRALTRVAQVSDSEPSHADRVIEQVDRDSGQGEVAALVADLKPRDRDVLLLHAWGELTYEEIADALDLPIGTVRSCLSRVRTKLRTHLLTNSSEGHPS